MALTAYLGLSLWILCGLIGLAILTFLSLAMVTKIITGEEQLIYYHHEIGIMIMATIFLKIINHPILPYLDITILGIGTFLFCGRVGCLMVGCCHGRPHKWGVFYHKEHADAGFTHYYLGVRLFPIQALESIWVLMLVIVGCFMVLGRQAPGEALAWYVITYDIGRFIFEFARGDPERPYHSGFSEGQWTSVILMIAVMWGELAGLLPFHLWHITATAGIVLIMTAVATNRKFRSSGKHKLHNPRHVKEIADAIDKISSSVSAKAIITDGHTAQDVIPIATTSLNIQISTGAIKDTVTHIDHYALSYQNRSMTEETARTVADLIIQVKKLSGASRLITRGNGVYHLLIKPHNEGVKRWASTL
ncbi:MAG: hypothetical protein HKM93_13070 [Desulfobacteraceae bacterium]|nr:hypothetical protein [Desulfobacteraceae bacterium]